MKYDEKINVALGMSAKTKIWKNKKVSWSWLVNKLIAPNYTNETYAEFISSDKSDQMSIKDVGGYVGGYLRNGRRNPQNVVNRQLLTLDVDHAHLSFWDDFTLMYGCAAVCHGTHKHSEKTPRYRLVIPLDREVSPDQYVAISRMVAGSLGIELFDNTTFEVNRLMFWPSSPKDVKYFSEYQDAPFLIADEVLGMYPDWTDSSLWPTSQAFADETKSAATKQADPLEKRGVIGAFCRTYTITEVIEKLLTDEYTPAMQGRYTYAKGTAAAGLIVYDDKFSYSHHGTDPTSGMLCNAFDLCRVHKFGHLGEKESFKSMEKFAIDDKKVKGTIADETIRNAKYTFVSEPEEADKIKDDWEKDQDLEWAKDLDIDGRGQYLSNANNLNLIFQNDPVLCQCFRYNVFDSKRYVFRSFPWRSIGDAEPVRNVDYSGVRNYIESTYNISGNLKIDDALALEFERLSFHPVRQYLDGLTWDGVNRIENLLPDFFGVTPNNYVNEAIKKMMCGAVARIFKPGVKFDLVLTLVGKQGDGKSTFIRKLGKGFSSDSFSTVQGKEAFEQLQGAWLMEIAELAGLRKSDIESVKHYISKQEDTFRPAFAKSVETFKRQCVFIATSNKDDFLQDPTGNRRFMPIDTNKKDAKLDVFKDLDPIVDQLWAEAVTLYKSGEPLYLSKQAEITAVQEQRNHSQTDERKGVIETFLEMGLPDTWNTMDVDGRRLYFQSPNGGTIKRQNICVAQIWCECLGKPKEDMSRYNTRELNDILRTLEGWEAQKSPKNFKLYGKQKYYKRVTI